MTKPVVLTPEAEEDSDVVMLIISRISPFKVLKGLVLHLANLRFDPCRDAKIRLSTQDCHSHGYHRKFTGGFNVKSQLQQKVHS